jgi:hypothetical protein
VSGGFSEVSCVWIQETVRGTKPPSPSSTQSASQWPRSDRMIVQREPCAKRPQRQQISGQNVTVSSVDNCCRLTADSNKPETNSTDVARPRRLTSRPCLCSIEFAINPPHDAVISKPSAAIIAVRGVCADAMATNGAAQLTSERHRARGRQADEHPGQSDWLQSLIVLLDDDWDTNNLWQNWAIVHKRPTGTTMPSEIDGSSKY